MDLLGELAFQESQDSLTATVISPSRLLLHKTGPLLIAAGLLVSCDTPQKRTLRELANAGIEPSGNALLQAVTDQDSRRAGWLLDVGVYTEQRDARDRTPVRIAIENRDVPSVFKLLEARANVNATAADQVSILGLAVERWETAITDKLLAAGARSDGLMPDGEKILPWAIRHGRMTIVRAMLKSGADPHLRDRLGNPLLHVAMESGQRELAESLIALGADPGATNAAGGNWNTWLWKAFEKRDHETARLLLSHGAKASARGPHGLLLVEIVAQQQRGSFVKMLTDFGAPAGDALYQSSARGDLDMVSLLISCGQPVNVTRIPTRDTPLAAAIRNKQDRVASLLIQNGADVSLRLPEGQTPLHLGTLSSSI